VNLRLGEDITPAEMDKLLEEQAKLQDAIEAAKGWDLDRTLEIAMDALRLPPGDADVTKLSGGERRRVALCKILLQRPDLLLLDEPTNHLDAESVAWLEHHLQEYPGTIVAVTHDRYFLDNVAGWILELDRGEGIPWEGNYSSWLDQKRKRLAGEEKAESARQRTLPASLNGCAPRRAPARPSPRRVWPPMRRCSPRSRRSAKTPSRSAFPRGRAWATWWSRPRTCARATAIASSSRTSIQSAPRWHRGRRRRQRRGQDHALSHDLGQEKPDSGVLRLGDSVKLSYVDQSRDALKGDNSVFQEIAQGAEFFEVGKRTINVRAYVSGFGFRGPDQQKRMKDLSGGERNRVHLAKLLRSAGNVLLARRTDQRSRRGYPASLEDALLSFPGCAVVISHDRWFLDRIATHMLAFEGDSQVVWFEGNYQDYEADRRRRLGAEAAQPHRIKYRKLIH
jgi:sulfate-transporting ATPase